MTRIWQNLIEDHEGSPSLIKQGSILFMLSILAAYVALVLIGLALIPTPDLMQPVANAVWWVAVVIWGVLCLVLWQRRHVAK